MLFDLLARGEGPHTYHRRKRAMARQGMGWKPVNLNSTVISLIVWLRLAWNVRTVSLELVVRRRDPMASKTVIAAGD